MPQVDLAAELRSAIVKMEAARLRCDRMEAAALARFEQGDRRLPGNPQGLADAWLRTDGDYKAAMANYRYFADRVRTLTSAINALRGREGAHRG